MSVLTNDESVWCVLSSMGETRRLVWGNRDVRISIHVYVRCMCVCVGGGGGGRGEECVRSCVRRCCMCDYVGAHAHACVLSIPKTLK